MAPARLRRVDERFTAHVARFPHILAVICAPTGGRRRARVGTVPVRALAVEKIADLEAKIVDLQAMRAGLARQVQTCEQPRDGG